MGVAADIGRSLRHGPVAVMREHLARGENEARALAFLMLGCFLVFVAQWPRHARTVRLEGDEFARLVAYDILAWLVIWPLVFYALAALTHLVSRSLGGRGTPATARLALFWSWLAASPLALLTGLLGGVTGSAALANAAGILWVAVFAAFWWLSQREAARGPEPRGI
jgi:hypothetical protein